MPNSPLPLIQYGVFGFLFVAGTLGYFWVSAKLKDPRRIYQVDEK